MLLLVNLFKQSILAGYLLQYYIDLHIAYTIFACHDYLIASVFTALRISS